LGSCSGAAGLEGVWLRAGFDGVDGVEEGLTSFSDDVETTSLSVVDFIVLLEVSTDLSSSMEVVASELATEGLLSSSAAVSVGDDGFSSASVAGAS
jgi:hypothetical protein